MAQGIPGLSHYARHLPRMVLVLEQDLPVQLSKVIKHMMLIPSNGRSNHWLASDEFLEINNYWLKHIYNNTLMAGGSQQGNGTNIHRLMARFSSNMPLLKMRSGHNLVFQNNPNKVSNESMKNFLRYARQRLVETCNPQNVTPVANVFAVGVKAMMCITQAERAVGLSLRYCWGGPNSVQADEDDDEAEEPEEETGAPE
ncbi:hypothetical protein DFH28DRAFT_1125077 [Melampsora americana]|nr:hypothetical protein DFH28DRAFT_1125077 [Melampsora americana]